MNKHSKKLITLMLTACIVSMSSITCFAKDNSKVEVNTDNIKIELQKDENGNLKLPEECKELLGDSKQLDEVSSKYSPKEELNSNTIEATLLKDKDDNIILSPEKELPEAEGKEADYELEVKTNSNEEKSDDGLVRIKLHKDIGNNYELGLKPNMFFTSSGVNGTHQFIARHALQILQNDKGKDSVQAFEAFKNVLLNYCDQPDKDEKDWVYAYHFYNPKTGENYLPHILPQSRTTALTKFKEHAMNALNNYKSNKNYAIQELGRATHFLEDVSVPYHAANMIAVLTYHSQYEQFVEDNQEKYALNHGDKYDYYSSTSFENYCDSLLKDCAEHSYTFKDIVEDDKSSWNSVADRTVKYSQASVAAFYNRFLHEVGEL